MVTSPVPTAVPAECERRHLGRRRVPEPCQGGWAEKSGRRAGGPARGGLRFVFYGRVSTEDWQDPVTSRARQREQAEALVRDTG